MRRREADEAGTMRDTCEVCGTATDYTSLCDAHVEADPESVGAGGQTAQIGADGRDRTVPALDPNTSTQGGAMKLVCLSQNGHYADYYAHVSDDELKRLHEIEDRYGYLWESPKGSEDDRFVSEIVERAKRENIEVHIVNLYS